MRIVIFASILSFLCTGCTAISVAGSAVSIGASAVGVAADVAGAGVSVAGAGVKAVVGSSEEGK